MIVITGATGQLGHLIVDAVLQRVPASQVAVSVRDKAKAADLAARGVAVREADYGKPETLVAALAGAETLMLVSGDADNATRIAQHRNAIAAAKAAGVQRVVYTSYLDNDPASPFTFAAVHGDTEQALRDSGLAFTILRPSTYADLLVMNAQGAMANGAYATAAPAGKTSSIARADIARVAAIVLTQSGHDGKVYELTGPEALGAADVAAIIAKIAGKPIPVAPITPEQLAGFFSGTLGMPPFLVEALVGAQAAVEQGRMARVTDTVEKLTGQAPLSVEQVLRAALGGAKNAA
ncbi:SDR family oxidoreductase [Ferrovibrio sp.]|uniref:SDR family oxidoreductase n=1 Tax=Ferrovibrio sp. TaxID=1917215 RepID=UPI0026124892|nr:SDR family oxidoreductase [Ferrovibrio sp.]